MNVNSIRARPHARSSLDRQCFKRQSLVRIPAGVAIFFFYIGLQTAPCGMRTAEELTTQASLSRLPVFIGVVKVHSAYINCDESGHRNASR